MAGVALLAFFGGLWFVSRGKWMGFGDAKLALGIGFFLGLEPSLSAMMLAFWTGAALGLFLIAIEHFRLPSRQRRQNSLGDGGAKPSTFGREIPFAPFLTLGTALVYFANLHVITLFIS